MEAHIRDNKAQLNSVNHNQIMVGIQQSDCV